MGLRDILFTSLCLFKLSCSSIEREVILPDEDNIYKLTFPDTTFRDEIKRELWFLLKDSLDGKKYFLLKYFDSNVDDIPDLAVGYYLKRFNRENGEYEIDSIKAPPIILRGRNINLQFVMYYYNKDKKIYEFYDLFKKY